MRTKRVRSVAIAAVVAAGLVLVVSACGGGGGGSGSSSSTSSTTGKTFPELKVVWGTTDYMDPWDVMSTAGKGTTVRVAAPPW